MSAEGGAEKEEVGEATGESLNLLAAALRRRLPLVAVVEDWVEGYASSIAGGVRSIREREDPSLRTMSLHSGSSHLHIAVRWILDLPSGEGKYIVVGLGKVKTFGGDTGWREGEDQEGRSEGRRAAVQSRPIHQR